MGDEVILFVEDSILSFSIAECRICHDEEVGSSKRLEAPCACSGTVKFAHRECIQRWCDEKGDTTCEICLQKFEPGYTAPPKKAQTTDVVVTIRGGSLEVPHPLRRQEQELQNPGLMAIVAAEPEFSECSSAAERSASCRRFVVLTFGILLLLRHFLALLAGETDHHEFPVLTLLVLRAGGIIVPLYIVMRTITAVQRMQRQRQEFDGQSPLQVDEDEDNIEDEHLNHTVYTQVHT
ncbi:E3 ubiquitin-protein ligase MARCHF7 [Telopea speciosissima]|uniref:E3 ubiquitin-protein ligase MARCHF7 n=1 Tax=Telopea speciosissima TaxID=54955 RepID=UPI001CC36F7E|nr:E3 ubiquitin-protein ligase MARCHF7 [Telopea speciosissima]